MLVPLFIHVTPDGLLPIEECTREGLERSLTIDPDPDQRRQIRAYLRHLADGGEPIRGGELNLVETDADAYRLMQARQLIAEAGLVEDDDD